MAKSLIDPWHAGPRDMATPMPRLSRWIERLLVPQQTETQQRVRVPQPPGELARAPLP